MVSCSGAIDGAGCAVPERSLVFLSNSTAGGPAMAGIVRPGETNVR